MNLEITTEAQAEAAREILSLYGRIHELRTSLGNDDTQKSNLKAALSAYEAQKAIKDIALSELEMAMLVQASYKGSDVLTAIERLRDLRLAKREEACAQYTCNATDLGRAYLAQKPKMSPPFRIRSRVFDWVVWDTQHDIPAIYSWNEVDAIEICERMSKHWGVTKFEVREVR